MPTPGGRKKRERGGGLETGHRSGIDQLQGDYMKNVGQTDRLFRILIGLGILVFFLIGTWSAWAYLGVLLLATGLIGYCPLYSVFRVNTNRKPLTG